MNIQEFRKDCEEKKIPIIRIQSEKLLIDKVKNINPKKILELGMAVGYSAIIWATNTNAKIRCIELDPKNVVTAPKNFEKFSVNNVEIVHANAKEYYDNDIYDVIFIDAGKSWYKEYFDIWKNNITENSIIIFDNVDYHGLLKTNFRKHRTIVRKMNDFHDFINSQTEFYYKWYDIEDGLLILSKNEKNI